MYGPEYMCTVVYYSILNKQLNKNSHFEIKLNNSKDFACSLVLTLSQTSSILLFLNIKKHESLARD